MANKDEPNDFILRKRFKLDYWRPNSLRKRMGARYSYRRDRNAWTFASRA